ncbi:MAG: restriction endonuclease subunit S [Rhodocyclaceae bacterium]|nr:restriction endonuclease subunit S [Rhodocyclaceae bacterium]
MGREGEYGEFGEGNGVKAWQQLSLGDIADIQTGPFGSQLHAADYVDSGIPSIMPTNIGNRLEIRTEGIACIKEADAQRLERYLVRVNDVVYSRRGDVEKCAFITSRENGWLCGTGCLRVRFTSNEVKPKFCAYYLSTEEIRGWVKGHAIGTTMPNLNSSILQRLPLLLPPVPEQEAIIAVLGNLDAKIDLLHRQNTTLEAMAETLFRQWFVEAPVRTGKAEWSTL